MPVFQHLASYGLGDKHFRKIPQEIEALQFIQMDIGPASLTTILAEPLALAVQAPIHILLDHRFGQLVFGQHGRDFFGRIKTRRRKFPFCLA